MKKIINKIKMLDDRMLKIGVLSILLIQPLLELDYLAYGFLNQFGIPRPSTVFHLIIIPIIIMLTFIKSEQQKKKIGIVTFGYLALLGIYVILHSTNAINIYSSLNLTTNFFFSNFGEIVYIFTLVIPYFITYSLYKTDINDNDLMKVVLITSLAISLSIILGDLFLFGKSTYSVWNTHSSIFSWFGNIYDTVHPRELASKFFFPEGNTLGIYQFIILPILYYYLSFADKKNEKIILSFAIFSQSISMLILSTRIATYGAPLVAFWSFGLYLLFLVLKKVKLNKTFLAISLITGIISAAIIPYSPAYMNQVINSKNNAAVKNDDFLVRQTQDAMKGLVPDDVNYNFALIHMFEVYALGKDNGSKLLSSIPTEYYLSYYYYTFDPVFWMSVINDYPLEQRSDGRKFELIFNNYKWGMTNTYTKFMGMGYTTFMNGSILLEKDFAQQKYTLGYLGTIITLSPWILGLIYGIYCLFRNFKNMFNFKTSMFAFAYICGLVAAYTSGHTLDQYLTTTILALVLSVLLKECKKEA